MRPSACSWEGCKSTQDSWVPMANLSAPLASYKISIPARAQLEKLAAAFQEVLEKDDE